MNADELQQRAKAFALRIIKLVDSLPERTTAREIGRQLLRSGTSVSANYRAARRARSHREFVAKLCIVTEEADESAHWLELIIDAGLLAPSRVKPLHTEAVELMRIFARSRRTASVKQSPNRQITKSPNKRLATKET